MNTKIVAIAAVAIVVVAAVGAGIVLMNDGNGGDPVGEPLGCLEVFGNANNDYVIDGSDISLINRIIDEGMDWKEDYPFADAYKDGVIDQRDVDQVNGILNATFDNKIEVWHTNYYAEVQSIVTTMYPIQTAAASANNTTMILFKSLGIDEQIVATSLPSSNISNGLVDQSKYDSTIYADYFDVMNEAQRIGSESALVTVDSKLTDFVTAGCSAYIFGSANPKLTNESAIEDVGVDVIQICDGMSDSNYFATAALLLGFLFNQTDDGIEQRAASLTDFVKGFNDDLSNKVASITNAKAGVASSMKGYISIKGSTNTDIIEEAGLICPVASKNPENESSTTIKYTSDANSWLNYVGFDYAIVLKASTSGWSWFDKSYDSGELPSSFKTHVNSFNTTQSYINGNVLVVSTMLLGPLKSGVICQYVYPEICGEGWIDSYLNTFYTTYWGMDADDINGMKYILTQDEVLGTA